MIWATDAVIIILLAIAISNEIIKLKENRQKSPFESRGRKKKIAGIIVFGIGILSCIYAVLALLGATIGGDNGAGIFVFILGPIGVLLVPIGILYFISGKRDVEL